MFKHHLHLLFDFSFAWSVGWVELDTSQSQFELIISLKLRSIPPYVCFRSRVDSCDIFSSSCLHPLAVPSNHDNSLNSA